jgi:hypothetical protein
MLSGRNYASICLITNRRSVFLGAEDQKIRCTDLIEPDSAISVLSDLRSRRIHGTPPVIGT